MTSSNVGRSQSNIYLDDPDSYHQNHNNHYLSAQYSVSTSNMPSMVAASTLAPPSSSSMLKGASSMQQLKDSRLKTTSEATNITEQQNMNMDYGYSTLSIPQINEQQFLNERLLCIQQMIASGQNFASMFNDDPYFAQQIMSSMSSAHHYPHQQQEEPEVIEIMDE